MRCSCSRRSPFSASRFCNAWRSVWRAGAPRSKKALRLLALAAFAASAACPSNSPASQATLRSKMQSPTATPPRGCSPSRLKMPSGRLARENSEWPLADSTQLRSSVRAVMVCRVMSFLVLVEGLGQAGPAVVVVILQLRAFQCLARRAKHLAGFEHEGHGVLDLVRFEFSAGRLFGRDMIGPISAPATVQRGTTGRETVGLGIVGAGDQAHELVHQVAMEPRRTEGVFRHHPARRKDHEVDVGHAMDG